MELAVGDYIIKEKIADGGMGEVFKAVKKGILGFEKNFVLKKLLPYYADDENFINMLIKEAKLSSFLDHPNIVQTLDFFELSGDFFLVMEYVHGKNLGEVLAKSKQTGTRPDPHLCLFMIAETVKGLNYAHNFSKDGEPLKIIHRDISPQNLLVSYEGQIKVADFGIASTVADERRTKTGEIKGKINYLSPEQIRKESIDERSDIFSTCCVLYEMIYLQKPFQKESEFETLKNIAESSDEPVFTTGDATEQRVTDLVRRGLKKDPKERPQSSGAFLKELFAEIPEEIFKNGHNLIKELMDNLFSTGERTHRQIEKTPILKTFRSFSSIAEGKSLISVEQSIKKIKRKRLYRNTLLASLAGAGILASFYFRGNNAGHVTDPLPSPIPASYSDRLPVAPPANAALRGFGSVSIFSKPKAKAYINGKDFKNTPIKNLRLKEGDYILNLVFPNGKNIIRPFQVLKDKKRTIFEKLPEK